MENKTFSKDEIRDFLFKLSREAHGEALLLPTMNTLTNPEVLEGILLNSNSLADFLADLSKKQGIVEGKVEIIQRLIDFFEIKPTK